jgi:nicotinate-nucleotide adenylyltransferase
MRKIGLLGGSFNPAHTGHLHISLHAMRRLGLDEIWWLVSPQNPLKSSEGMADYTVRRNCALQMIESHPALRLCEIEQDQGLQYTADTLTALTERHSGYRFIWLMGSDNLAQFHHWHRWEEILQRAPICIIDRAPHSHASLRSRLALRYKHQRVSAQRLINSPTPCWSYFFIPRHPESATRLREAYGDKAF